MALQISRNCNNLRDATELYGIGLDLRLTKLDEFVFRTGGVTAASDARNAPKSVRESLRCWMQTNQGRFYPDFDHLALLSTPVELLFARIDARVDNAYGQISAERELILSYLVEVEPLLRASVTIEIDPSAPLEDVVDQPELPG